MKKVLFIFTALALWVAGAQEKKIPQGHGNTSKFRQLYDLLPTPNMYRSADGAPGPAYFQNRADYVMDIELVDDPEQPVLKGEETIIYYNNSPQPLQHLWVQLDQNRRMEDNFTELTTSDGDNIMLRPGDFIARFTDRKYKGGYTIHYVKDAKGRDLPYDINYTMMRVDLPEPLKPGEKYAFKIKWEYNINNLRQGWARSGYEEFEDGRRLYAIAQFFPRMAVYSDVEGWQTNQYIGTGEFALPFGNYTVNIKAPAHFVIDGTGKLVNRQEMFTREQWMRWLKAMRTFDRPVRVITPEEAENNFPRGEKTYKTWQFKANDVRDFAFAASPRFIYDAMGVKIGGKTKMAIAMYPPEARPIWEKYGVKAVAHTLRTYSDMLFDYPYHKAIAVNVYRQGMEYPMISWNYGRANPDGTYSDRLAKGVISVIIHEVGHNWFPMVVNSDERQWMWMDEGLNTFIQLRSEQMWEKGFPSRGYPKDLVDFLLSDQSRMQPIMVNADQMYNRGKTAYHKTAAGLYILREVVLGHDRFDRALKTYANRWKFKHPTPADFFRTMEDASGTDLDWFWRGWFFTTDVNDIGIKKVTRFYVTDKPTSRVKAMARGYGMKLKDFPVFVSLVAEDSPDFDPSLKKKKDILRQTPALKEYLKKEYGLKPDEVKYPKYFYRVTFEKNGGLVMPIVLVITYEDGTKEKKIYPAEIWRFNDKEVSKLIVTDKEIVKLEIDPENITADVNPDNNVWPREEKNEGEKREKEKAEPGY
ncbi:MAG: M1 family metallopeptidase [Chlorobi bacterium]|nr:M1 family metallopeptidase [Chlorobiota bacterium]